MMGYHYPKSKSSWDSPFSNCSHLQVLRTVRKHTKQFKQFIYAQTLEIELAKVDSNDSNPTTHYTIPIKHRSKKWRSAITWENRETKMKKSNFGSVSSPWTLKLPTLKQMKIFPDRTFPYHPKLYCQNPMHGSSPASEVSKPTRPQTFKAQN